MPEMTPGRDRGKMTRRSTPKLSQPRSRAASSSLSADDVHGAQVQGAQEGVQDAGVLQDGHPGVGADQEVHPHGDHDQGDEDLLGAGRGAGEDEGDGIAHQEAEDGGDHRQLQRAPEDEQVGVGDDAVRLARRGEEAGDVRGGEGEVVVGEGVVGDEAQGHDDEEQRPQAVGGQGQAPGQAQSVPFLHASAPLSAWESSSYSSEKEE